MDSVDAVVIGAGVVGLAVARALALQGRETLVLERGSAIGQGVSSRNSEVIHAGLYYPTGSLKARLCVRGRELLYDWCERHGVEHRRCGKLVVATDVAQLDALHCLHRQGQANGVSDLALMDAAQAAALEPQLQCAAALLSPSTGIVDSHGLMLSLQGELERAGGVVALNSEASGLRRANGHWVIEAGGMELAAACVVNAAGLWAPWLAARTDGLGRVPGAFICKGSYFTLAGRAPFSRLVYPMPRDGGLGVHLTLDLGGQARFGPDTEWLGMLKDPDGLDYAVNPARADAFYADVRQYWPALLDGALQPAYSGVRPKIHGPGETADFRIDGPNEHGLPGLINLFGIESPGLTSCLAIAERVAELAAGD